MKKLLFAALTSFLMVGAAMGQLPIKKGDVFINANISNFSMNFNDEITYAFEANGGYFLFDHLALTGGISFANYWNDARFSITPYTISSFGINAGARYYFMERNKGSFFADGLMSLWKLENDDAFFQLQLNAGYAIFLNEHVALEPMITLKVPFREYYDTVFSIGGGISIYF